MASETNGPTILLVEDRASARRSIRAALLLHGYRVVEATNGLEALGYLKTESFAAVITDVWMPRIDGVELMASIRKNYPHLPVIAISGGDPGRRPIHYSLALAASEGADAVFNKPFDNDDLIKTLNQLLSQIG